MKRIWQLFGISTALVLGLAVGVAIPGIPDSIVFLLWAVCLILVFLSWGRYQEQLREERENRMKESQAEFHRLYVRYREARKAALREYLGANAGLSPFEFETMKGFKFPNFAEWREDRAETD
ncbi:hypothetical protein SEA_MAMAPEARL_38 [Arthrobacter phage MamaPearl]|uniref:Uncharacterized protein n=1 Tax=Arthrobacter phage MamaPearl TaxID=2743906 RepID=A0AAE7F727_9CAUD|nr:hypothetical protein KDJ03_gp38 [Arthrobacter phage MamaPearl]QDH48226.1 hypothetical protein SEA_ESTEBANJULIOR_38 [Arthrobacter phage EstebanJulior]QKY79108.1 hypothetical protein SEA_MAMAPEARL_38 [Arthrobacter phage MamaPearl]